MPRSFDDDFEDRQPTNARRSESRFARNTNSDSSRNSQPQGRQRESRFTPNPNLENGNGNIRERRQENTRPDRFISRSESRLPARRQEGGRLEFDRTERVRTRESRFGIDNEAPIRNTERQYRDDENLNLNGSRINRESRNSRNSMPVRMEARTKFVEMRDIYTDHEAQLPGIMKEAISAWGNTDIGGQSLLRTSKIDFQRAGRTALSLEREARWLGKKSETIVGQSFLTTPENVLRIVRVGTANSNRGNWFAEYILNNYDDAFWILRTTRNNAVRGASAGESTVDKGRTFWGGEANVFPVGTGNGATTSFAITVTPAPIVRNSLRIFVDGSPVGTDDGAGGIVGSGITAASSSVNYSAATGTVVFAVAPVSGAIITCQANSDFELPANYGAYAKVGFEPEKKRFNARPMPIGYDYTRFAKMIIEKSNFGELGEIFISTIGNEHAKRRDLRGVVEGLRWARTNTIEKFNTRAIDSGEVSDKLHTQKLHKKFASIGGKIYNEIGRGGINVILTDAQGAAYFTGLENFKLDDTQPDAGVSRLEGYLGNTAVYKVQATPDEGGLAEAQCLLIHYNTTNVGEHSLAFGNMAEMTDELVNAQHRIEGTISTIEDFIPVQPKFLRILNLENLDFDYAGIED